MKTANSAPTRLNQRGTSVVEVMVAIVVYMTIMIGGINYFFLPQADIVRQKTNRAAVAVAHARMETLLALDYRSVTTDSNETATAVTLENVTGSRATTITYTDDAGDGLSLSDVDNDTLDLKTITVVVSWTDSQSHTIQLSTHLSTYGK